jgi:putative DNA primase/helicase
MSNLFTISFFNNKFENSAREESQTWASLLGIFSKPIIRNDKDGQLISGATFNGTRLKRNAIESSLLILDFDHANEIDLSIWQNMEITFAAYTTFSNATEEKPCAYRVVIPLSNPIPANKYPFLYQWAFDITNGLIDPACKDVCRMHYLPACPSEREQYFEFHDNDGAFLDWQPLIIPFENAQKPIRSPQNSVATQIPRKRDYSSYVKTVIENELNSVRNAVEGTRNNTLNKSSHVLAQLVSATWANVNEAYIESSLFDAAISAGLGEGEARATIKSGLESGKLQPREQPLDNDYSTIKYNPKEIEKPATDKPLKIELFVHSHSDKPISSNANFKVLLKEYGIDLKYNFISKEEEFYQNNQRITGAESDNIAISKLTNICRINRMPTSDVSTYSTEFASENSYNPIVDFIESKKWDGVNRLKNLFETIETSDDFSNDLKVLLLSKWFISCVAAAYNKDYQFWSKGVLVFQGKQSVGKTSWFKSLLPKELNQYIKDGVSLDLESKDSILKAIEHWIVELGELDATFKKSDIAKLKAFISEKIDIVRRPYAKRESKYPRQTVFCASVNDKDFLKDSSGNVRFWVIPVLKLNAYHNIDMQQVWAEVAHSYKQEQNWWLTREEEVLLESSNQHFVEENRFAAAFHEKFDWKYQKPTRLNAHDALVLIGFEKHSRADISDMNKLLTQWFGEQHKSGKLRFYVTNNYR